MIKIKPYITSFLIGVIFTLMAGAATLVVIKKTKPIINKVMSKASDWRFNRVEKSKTDCIIADFESKNDLEKFTLADTEAEISKEHYSQGNQSAKVIFKKSQAPTFKISKYLERNRSLSNWATYGSFLVDIYNPQETAQRFLLQIKDTSGDKFKQSFGIDGHSKDTVEVDIASLRNHISVYNISQINIFLWNPGRDVVLFIDNIRLASSIGPETKKSIFDPTFTDTKGPVYATGDYFSFPKEHWKIDNDTYGFLLHIYNPNHIKLYDFPARGGIPFPKGELDDKNEVLIKDSEGNIVQHQSKVMAKWKDGSIKWLLLDMPVTEERQGEMKYYVNYPIKNRVLDDSKIASESGDGITVDTGKIQFFINKGGFRLFGKVSMGKDDVISKTGDLTLKFRKDIYRSSNDRQYELTLEESGPLVATIKAEGWFINKRGARFCKFITRIKAYKNESFVKVFHTFIYTGYPENKHHYLYQGKRLPKNETIEEVAIEIDMPQVGEPNILSFGGNDKTYEKAVTAENIEISQLRDDIFTMKEGQSKILEGNRLYGWLDLSTAQQGLCVIIRKLWQQYPKSFEVNTKNNLLTVKLWPKEAGDLDLKTTERANGPDAVARGSAFGLAKTHEITFYFHKGDYKEAKVQNLAFISQEPPLVTSIPEWFSDTRVLGALSSYNEGLNYFKSYEDCIERLFDWGDRQKKTFRRYGMIDFGDTLTEYGSGNIEAQIDESGWYRDGRWGWYNCSVMGLNLGSFLQFLRTGQYKYFEFGEDNTRHIMDIDTCHYNTVANDKGLRRTIPEDYSQVGSMHRHNADHWGGRNEMAGYTNLNGILLYYYLTGNERALDVAMETGEFFLKRPVTYFHHPDIAPGRAVANILWGEVALYEATQDERLKKEADYWADVFFKGQNRNGGLNEDYNPVAKKWNGAPHHMYISGYILPALIEYHKLTGNRAIAESVIKLTDYMRKHDKYYPFFDGLSYSYYLTGEKEYLRDIEDTYNFFLKSQRKQNDPLWNGMIFQKLTYTRNGYFIYSMPYAFEALLEPKKQREAIKINEVKNVREQAQ